MLIWRGFSFENKRIHVRKISRKLVALSQKSHKTTALAENPVTFVTFFV